MKGSEIQSLSIPRAAKPEVILQTLRAQTSLNTLGCGGEGLSGHYAFDRQGILYQSVHSFSSPK